jgi:hypothetical protein
MKHFRSSHYPSNTRRFLVLQELALRYYGIFSVFIMIGVLAMLSAKQPGDVMFWFVMIGMFFGLILGNMMAYVKMRKSWAEIFFVGNSFTLLSAYDILYGAEPFNFPIAYANPNRNSRKPDEIHLHYGDQIVVLHRKDWEDFDLIWAWLNPMPHYV